MAWYVLPSVLIVLGLAAIVAAWLVERRRRTQHVSDAWIAHRYRRHGDTEGRFWKGDD